MTSSLVGSEMCIRDSRRTYRDSIQQTGAPVGSLGPETTVAERPDEDETVSYTHLTLPTICSV
eukprot:5299919-Prorocentrum_lima.AAC.1